MRNLSIAILISLCSVWVAAQDAAPSATSIFSDHPARVVGNINGLNVRSSPAIEADNIVGRLQPGQQVHVLARDGDWQQVRSEDGQFGWSHSDYLIDMPPRQLGETRLFRIHDAVIDSSVLVNGELRHISQHSLIYVIEHPRQIDTVNLNELQTFAIAFDEEIYPETIALWDPNPKPNHEGDERIVILFSVGYQNPNTYGGFYHGRNAMPGELHPYGNRTGFLEIIWGRIIDTHPSIPDYVAAHELQHLIQHQFDGDEPSWVNEGLSALNNAYVDSSALEWIYSSYIDLHQPYCQLNSISCGYSSFLLFTTYILEQLGLEALQDFARRSENGLAALDALLADLDSGLDTETFFADFVLADYFRDTQLEDGRFGYRMLGSTATHRPYTRGRITSLPTLIRGSLPPYATDFYRFALPASDQSQHLELALQFPNSAAQDGWLQLVQVVAGDVVLERYRASDYRNQMIPAELHPDAEQAFLAISPFRADARYLTAKQPYTLKIHLAGSEVSAADYSSFESSLSPDSAEPARAAGQRSPAQLAAEIDAILDEIIENRNRIGEYIAQVEALIAAGAAINGSNDGTFLVKVVGRIQSPALLTLFLENGANPNRGENYSFSPSGITGTYPANPMNYAVFFGDSASLRLLLDAGATVDNATLRLASTGGVVNYGGTRIISLLLADGANSSYTASGLRAAAEVARQRGHHAIADMLEAAAAN